MWIHFIAAAAFVLQIKCNKKTDLKTLGKNANHYSRKKMSSTSPLYRLNDNRKMKETGPTQTQPLY